MGYFAAVPGDASQGQLRYFSPQAPQVQRRPALNIPGTSNQGDTSNSEELASYAIGSGGIPSGVSLASSSAPAEPTSTPLNPSPSIPTEQPGPDLGMEKFPSTPTPPISNGPIYITDPGYTTGPTSGTITPTRRTKDLASI